MRRNNLALMLLASASATVVAVAVLAGGHAGAAGVTPAGTIFTYQGRLLDAGELANGPHDFEFSLWDAVAGPNQIGVTQIHNAVPVADGLFTVLVDFGADAFNGRARWLEIVVDTTILSPRQPLTPAPIALTLPGLWTQQNATSPNLIGGLSANSVTTGVFGATISGGGESGFTNRVTDDFGTIGGGQANQAGNNAGTTADRPFATVGGGLGNTAGGSRSTVGGGTGNSASGTQATVGGGAGNDAIGDWGTVGGGQSNIASGGRATVGGGASNTASGFISTVSGGSGNTASRDRSTIGGGFNNTASGLRATVPGGHSNTATGDYSFAAGRRAKATLDGAFCWADATNQDFQSFGANTFSVRASGGTIIVSNAAASTGVILFPGGTAWSIFSDRSLKANFAPVDGRDILERLASIPMETWNLKSQDPSIRHIGLMAQDFYAAFSVGEDNTHISTLDADGVALAAIQGLYENVQERDEEISDLQARLTALEALVEKVALQQDGGTP